MALVAVLVAILFLYLFMKAYDSRARRAPPVAMDEPCRLSLAGFDSSFSGSLTPLTPSASTDAPKPARSLPLRPGRRSGNGQYAGLPGRRGAGAQRAFGRRGAAGDGQDSLGRLRRGPSGQADGRPNARLDLRRPPAAKRGHHRFRALRGDAAVFPAEGRAARLAAAAARAGRRSRLHHAGREAGGVQQRSPRRRRPGVGDARGEGRRDRRRACPSPSRRPAWSATSAAARPKWP